MDVLTIKVGDESVTISTETARLYRFRDKPQMDHIFVQTPERSFYIFDAPAVFTYCEDTLSVLIDTEPPRADIDAYIQYCNQQLELDLEKL